MINPVTKLYEAFYRRKYAKAAPLSAARINAVSESLISAITAHKVQSLDKAPLFAVIGETHDQPVHRLILLKTVLGLKQKGFKVNVGFEEAYNFPEHAIGVIEKNMITGEGIDEGSKKTLSGVKDREFDDPGKTYFVNYFAPSEHSTHTSKYLQEQLFAHRIRYAMNDAARLYDGEDSPKKFRLDMKDPLMQGKLTDEERANDSACILATSNRGIFLRNQIMVGKAREHAGIRESDIYLQYCGSAHVVGNTNTKYEEALPYNESLLALFNKAECNSLGFILGCDYSHEYVQIPQEADTSLVSKIKVNDVSAPGWLAAREKVWLEEVKKHLTGPEAGPA